MEAALCKVEVLEPIYPLDIVRIMRDQRGMLVQTPVSLAVNYRQWSHSYSVASEVCTVYYSRQSVWFSVADLREWSVSFYNCRYLSYHTCWLG